MLLRSTRAVRRARSIPASRAISLWSSSTAAIPSLVPEKLVATPTLPGQLPDGLAEIVLDHSGSIFEPLSTAFLTLPPLVGISGALLIPLLTALIRTTTTLPVTLWQRQRTRKLEDVVIPLIRTAQTKLSYELRDECRRQGKSHAEYQKIFTVRAKTRAKALTAEHGVTPMVTLLVPPLIHLPIFVTSTLVLRDACTRALASLDTPPPPLLSASTFSNTPLDLLTSLHAFAVEPILWCPSTVLPDPSLALPLAVGLAALLNVEVSAKNRRAIQDAATGYAALRLSKGTPIERPLSVTARQRLQTKVARKFPAPGKRGFAASSTSTKLPAALEASPEEPSTARRMTFVLRAFSIAFIPVAAFSPAAVCTYWLTSNLFTLLQNSIFAVLDRRREAEKLLQVASPDSVK